MLQQIENVAYWFFSHPILGSALGFIGIFLAYYFFRLQTGKEKKIDQTIARLQEEIREVRGENAKLIEELVRLGARKTNASALPVAAGREFVVINLRGKWQKEDKDITFLQAGLPAIVIGCIAAICLGAYWYQSAAETAEDWAPVIVFVSGVIGLFVAGTMVGLLKNLVHQGKDKRLTTSFLDADLSLTEVDHFRRWAFDYPWRYFSRDSIIRDIDSLAVVKSQQALKKGPSQASGG